MKRQISIFFVFLIISLFSPNCGKQAPAQSGYPVAAVPLTQVDITDDFWAPKQVVNRTVSLQHVFKRGEETRGGGAAQLYEAAGPPAAMTIREDTIWREFGIIEWRVK